MSQQSFVQTSRRVVVATAMVLSVTSGAMAVPAFSSLATPSGLTFVQYQDATQAQRQHRYGRRHGYRVNRYGYGNYVRGPNGGFGGYPAGSAGATILRQQQHDKCEAVPESC